MNEKGLNSIQINVQVPMETMLILRRVYGTEKETGKKLSDAKIASKIVVAAADGILPTKEELDYCREYARKRYDERMENREKRKTGRS